MGAADRAGRRAPARHRPAHSPRKERARLSRGDRRGRGAGRSLPLQSRAGDRARRPGFTLAAARRSRPVGDSRRAVFLGRSAMVRAGARRLHHLRASCRRVHRRREPSRPSFLISIISPIWASPRSSSCRWPSFPARATGAMTAFIRSRRTTPMAARPA